MNQLYFGTAGIPYSTPKSGVLSGIEQVRKLGLGAMELEFVRSINISAEKAAEVKIISEKNGINLTCHGQYYINLSSLEKQKIEESKERILKAARIANLCGASSLTFHAGYYMEQNPEEVFSIIKKGMAEIIEILKSENNSIWLRPETTGKPSQWGTLPEIVRLSQEMDQVLPCIDFSHLHARSIGKNNTYEEFKEILAYLEKQLGRRVLDNMHIHVSGIEYGEKGEKWHLNLNQSDLRYLELLKALKEFKVKGIVISESPVNDEDALLMNKVWDKS